MSEPKSSEIMKHYNKEVEEQFDEFDNSLKKIDEIIKSAIDSNKPMGKKALEHEIGIETIKKDSVKFLEDKDN